MITNFTSQQFLDQEEIQKACDSIFKLEEAWIHRGKGLIDIPSYTLGASEYIDLEEKDREHYETLAAKNNPILWQEFGWLYLKTKDFFEELTNSECDFYREKAALPGFHIFLEDDYFEIATGARHCDLQYKKIDWQGMEYDVSSHISFTLYIKLPKLGGGMYSWDYSYQDLKDLSFEAREEKLHASPKTYLEYNEGDLVIHNGHQWHQIAPAKEIQAGDKRISFQGHLIKAGEKYWFHW